MKKWVRRTTGVGILSAGFLLIGATAANASTGMTSVGNVGANNGNQVHAPVQAPVNVCGNGLGAGGGGVGTCVDSGAAAVNDESGDVDQVSAGNVGLGNGNQRYAPVQVPVNVCGNGVGIAGSGVGTCVDSGAAAVLGHGEHGHGHDGYRSHEGRSEGAEAGRAGTGTTASLDRRHSRHDRDGGVRQVSVGNVGLGNGNQVYAPVQVPVNVCGNGVGILGAGVGTCVDSGAVAANESAHRSPESGGVDQVSAGNVGLGNGNQVYAPVQVPVNVCGNGVGALFGAGSGTCVNSGALAKLGSGEDGHSGYGRHESGHRSGGVHQVSAGNVGALNGNQLYAPIQVPVNVSGNGVGILGAGSGTSVNSGSAAVH